MLERDASKLIDLLWFIAATNQQLTHTDATRRIGGFNRSDFSTILSHLRELQRLAAELDLPGGQSASGEALALLEPALARTAADNPVMLTVSEFIKTKGLFDRLSYMKYEASNKHFLGLDARGAALWLAKEPSFGQTVHDAFPSARDDIEEAAKCLAVERGTACVMHLMRAMEAPLKALAAAIGVGQQNDWGSYIREIDKELEKRMKAAGKRSADESFYAETSEAFERVKRVWRNRSMHLEHSYSTERARDIFDATKGFMAHIAPRIHE